MLAEATAMKYNPERALPLAPGPPPGRLSSIGTSPGAGESRRSTMHRYLLAVVLATVFTATSFAADVRIDGVVAIPPNSLQVQLSCSQCPELVRILLPPVGTWINAESQELPDNLIDWEPIPGSVSSMTTRVVTKRRTTPLLPALVGIHWGYEIPNSPLASPGTPANLYVEGSKTCAVLQHGQQCEAISPGVCIMTNADPAFDQWCWAPQGAGCQLKPGIPRCLS